MPLWVAPRSRWPTSSARSLAAFLPCQWLREWHRSAQSVWGTLWATRSAWRVSGYRYRYKNIYNTAFWLSVFFFFYILILYTLPTLTAPFIRLQSPGCYTAPQGCCWGDWRVRQTSEESRMSSWMRCTSEQRRGETEILQLNGTCIVTCGKMNLEKKNLSCFFVSCLLICYFQWLSASRAQRLDGAKAWLEDYPHECHS